jgi:hypothetical protein
VILKIVPKVGYGMNTAENRQVTAKESRNRNSNAAFGKIFGIIKFFKEARRNFSIIYLFHKVA